jgi:Organic solute transporter Ostalpha
LTYADLNIGIPNLVTCVEMVPFSIFFHYAYAYRSYIIRPRSVSTSESNAGRHIPQNYQGGFLGLRAWLVMWNPKEILDAIAFAFRVTAEQRQNGQGYADGPTVYVPLDRQDGRGRD